MPFSRSGPSCRAPARRRPGSHEGAGLPEEGVDEGRLAVVDVRHDGDVAEVGANGHRLRVATRTKAPSGPLALGCGLCVRKALVISLLALVVLVGSGVAALHRYDASRSGEIVEGTTIGGVAVGGLSEAEARSRGAGDRAAPPGAADADPRRPPLRPRPGARRRPGQRRRRSSTQPSRRAARATSSSAVGELTGTARRNGVELEAILDGGGDEGRRGNPARARPACARCQGLGELQRRSPACRPRASPLGGGAAREHRRKPRERRGGPHARRSEQDARAEGDDEGARRPLQPLHRHQPQPA